MKLFLTRHGQTEDNLAGVTMGQQDSPLTEIGRARVSALGDMLKEAPIDAVYTSDLGRCLVTARIIAKAREEDTPVTSLVALRERGFGVYEKQPYTALPPRDPSQMTVAFPGGESSEAMALRVIAAMNGIYQKHTNQTVLVVTHFGPIATILASIEGISLYEALERRVENADLLELTIAQPLTVPLLA